MGKRNRQQQRAKARRKREARQAREIQRQQERLAKKAGEAVRPRASLPPRALPQDISSAIRAWAEKWAAAYRACSEPERLNVALAIGGVFGRTGIGRVMAQQLRRVRFQGCQAAAVAERVAGELAFQAEVAAQGLAAAGSRSAENTLKGRRTYGFPIIRKHLGPEAEADLQRLTELLNPQERFELDPDDIVGNGYERLKARLDQASASRPPPQARSPSPLRRIIYHSKASRRKLVRRDGLVDWSTFATFLEIAAEEIEAVEQQPIKLPAVLLVSHRLIVDALGEEELWPGILEAAPEKVSGSRARRALQRLCRGRGVRCMHFGRSVVRGDVLLTLGDPWPHHASNARHVAEDVLGRIHSGPAKLAVHVGQLHPTGWSSTNCVLKNPIKRGRPTTIPAMTHEELQELAKAFGSLRELAEVSGVPRGSLHRYLGGGAIPDHAATKFNHAKERIREA